MESLFAYCPTVAGLVTATGAPWASMFKSWCSWKRIDSLWPAWKEYKFTTLYIHYTVCIPWIKPWGICPCNFWCTFPLSRSLAECWCRSHKRWSNVRWRRCIGAGIHGTGIRGREFLDDHCGAEALKYRSQVSIRRHSWFLQLSSQLFMYRVMPNYKYLLWKCRINKRGNY